MIAITILNYTELLLLLQTQKMLLGPIFLNLDFNKVRVFYAEISLKSMEKFV